MMSDADKMLQEKINSLTNRKIQKKKQGAKRECDFPKGKIRFCKLCFQKSSFGGLESMSYFIQIGFHFCNYY